ncbi:SIS domain-containing protein [Rhodohalobacter sp. 614A]|uniref:SIS domain-containing protein n=1 Tax=Rhodohalobacter sp. 614A TaxID=2908649 RepID=UPI001F1CA400|nr:SIS domain-containing protein [Rhodohalobacter sp. 614A]
MDLEKINTTVHTRKEIEGQPDLWVETINSLKDDHRIREFLTSLFKKESLDIVLTGAGSSAFIGETVESSFHLGSNIHARAISTTTLVTHFEDNINKDKPLLLISFARSGNSPESNAVVNIAEKLCKDVHHIAITCNKNGLLAERIDELENGLAIVLPPLSEDQGLAMTGSFTSMVLSALIIAADQGDKEKQVSVINDIAAAAKKTIEECTPGLEELSFRPFDRIVFLGSGPLLGIARESHLKVQELSDGSICGKFDSFLGFRHGPKAVVNEETVIVFLFSTDEKVFKYEKDLAEQILQDDIAMHCIGVFCDEEQAKGLEMDQKIIFPLSDQAKKSAFNTVLYVVPAQILGFYKSLDLGLNPDSPSKNNVISRVVRGVKIYD